MKTKKDKIIICAVLLIIISINSSYTFAIENDWDTYPITEKEALDLGFSWYDCEGGISIGVSDSATSSPSSHMGIKGALHIPTSINGKRVISVGPYAFYGNSDITTVTIPRSITKIDSYAFSQCTNLEMLDLCEGITEISNYAFSKCESLLNLVTPCSLLTIKDGAFSECTSLNNVYFRNGIETIGSKAFDRCIALTTLFFPSSIKSINRTALNGDINIAFLNFETKSSSSIKFYPFGATSAITYWGEPDPGYNDTFNDTYEVTVPSHMEVDKEYSISAKGKIKFGKRLGIECNDTVTLKETSSGEELNLDIDFDGISLFGENNREVSQSETIKVNGPTEEKQGTYTGVIVYEIKLFY